MLALDYLIVQVLTPQAVNANIALLNGQYATLPGFVAAPMLDGTKGVVNMWTKAWSDMARPSIGYEVGFTKEAVTEIVLQGKNRDEIPVWIAYISENAKDELTARRQCEVTWEAIRMTLDPPTQAGLEGQILPGVTPIRGIVKIGPTVGLELVTVDATAAGTVLGVRSQWLMTLDTVRS